MSTNITEEPVDDGLSNTMWPLDVALGALGATCMLVVAQNFSFNDSRWLYNGWTYVAAIILGVFGLDVLFRKVASRFVQRSMQLGFLVSILVHLGFLMMALNVVLFVKLWPVPQTGKRPEPKPIRKTVPEHFFEKRLASSEQKQDWQKPVEIQNESREMPEPTKKEVLKPQEAPQLDSPDQPQVEVKLPASEMAPRRQVDTRMVTRQETLQLDRQAAATPQPTPAAQPAEVPELAAATSVKETLNAKTVELSPSRVSEPVAVSLKATAPQSQPRVADQPMATPAAAPTPQPRVAMLQRQISRNANTAAQAPPMPSLKAADVPVAQTTRGTEGSEPSPAVRTAPMGRFAQSIGADIPMAATLATSPAASGGLSASSPQYAQAAVGRDAPRVASALPGSVSSPLGRRSSTSSTTAAQSPASQGTVEIPSLGLAAAPTGGGSGEQAQEKIGDIGRIGAMTRGATAPAIAGPADIDPASLSGGRGLSNTLAARGDRGTNGDSPNPLASASRTRSLQRRSLGSGQSTVPETSKAALPFRRRIARMSQGGSPSEPGMAGPETEEAIELGLRFLASQQNLDGSWSLQAVDPKSLLRSDTAATGLCVLAFQGAGYTHRQHQYARHVDRGIDWLIQHQQPDGNLYRPEDDASNRNVWLYSHGVAALALCEAYGMTQDPKLQEPAQRAIDFIIHAQHPTRGGWRYQPQVSSDTSVSGWMIMAMKSGELAGLKVPPEGYSGVRRWLELSRDSGVKPYLFRYNPYAPDTPLQRHGRDVTASMTSVGLLMEMYLGWRRDNPNLQRGADWLLNYVPSNGTAANPQRDSYYWYYATQVMFHMGDKHWREWNRHLNPLLIDSQTKTGEAAGSWDPQLPVPDRWGIHAGRLYVTAMNLLNLEIYYRHLPIYEDSAH